MVYPRPPGTDSDFSLDYKGRNKEKRDRSRTKGGSGRYTSRRETINRRCPESSRSNIGHLYLSDTSFWIEEKHTVDELSNGNDPLCNFT